MPHLRHSGRTTPTNPKRSHSDGFGGLTRNLAPEHVSNDRGEAAYRHSDLFERRRTLMQQWADYLALL